MWIALTASRCWKKPAANCCSCARAASAKACGCPRWRTTTTWRGRTTSKRLFGGLKIGQNPTPLRNRYFILNLNFSVVDPQGDSDAVRASLFHHLNIQIKATVARYGDWLGGRVDIEPDDGIASFQSLTSAISQTPHKLYLLVDEYDNFANEVMISPLRGTDRYQRLVENEGTIKTFFKAVKAGAEGRGVDRVFLTGISPVVLSDMTSGYNVAEDLSQRPRFHDLCGFTETELRVALDAVAVAHDLDAGQVDTALTLMRDFYNGYRFAAARRASLQPDPGVVLSQALGRGRRYPDSHCWTTTWRWIATGFNM
jgi:hypothetical protein